MKMNTQVDIPSISVYLYIMLTITKKFNKKVSLIIGFIIYLPIYSKCSDIDNVFIAEYFMYKKSSSIIGFSCNREESDLLLLRKLSELQIKSAVWKMHNKSELIWLTKSLYWKMGIFFDTRCQSVNDIKSIYSKATDYRLFDESFHWLIIGSNLNDTLELVNDNSFGVSTDFVIAIFEEISYTVYDVYNPCKIRGGKLNIKLLGSWDRTEGFIFMLDHKKVDRWNLLGMTFKIAGLVNILYKNTSIEKILTDYSKKEEDTVVKLSYSIWVILAEMFNFTYVKLFRLSYSAKVVWKKGDKNGPVIGSLLTGEADGTGTPATMNHERLNSGKPVYPAIPFRSCFFFRSTSSAQINLKLIFEPLDPIVWYLTVIFIALSINIMVLLSIFTQTHLGYKYINAIMLNVSAFCQQGSDFNTTQLSGRIAIFYIFLFNLLLNNYYMASIVSARLNNPFKKINDSLNNLRKTDLTFASEKSLYFDFYMKRNDWETKSFYTNTWLKIPENKRFMAPQQALPLVMKGGFAYHTVPEIAYPYVERFFDNRKICELTEVHLLPLTQLSFFVQTNSSFTEMMKIGFARISEFGLRNRQIKRWLSRKPHCRIDILTMEQVTLNEVAPIIIFLLLGIILCSIVLLVEKYIYSSY